MDLTDALMVGMEVLTKEINTLRDKGKKEKRVNEKRILRLRELRSAYRLLDQAFDQEVSK